MSRIGKKPVPVPAGVTATIENGTLSVKGPKGTLSMPTVDDISYGLEDGAFFPDLCFAAARSLGYRLSCQVI